MKITKTAKFLLLGLILLSFTSISGAAADLNFSAGGGIWMNEGSGDIRYKNNPSVDIDDLDYDTENRGYGWAELRHPVPFLPNLRIEYSDVRFSGHSDTGFSWDDIDFEANSYSETQLHQLDMILFYNIFSQSGIIWDLGVDVKYMNFEFDAEGEGRIPNIPGSSIYYSVHEEEDLYIPFIYTKLRFDILKSGIGIEGELKYSFYKGSSAFDTSIKADYLFDLKPFKFGIEAGYRFENIDLDQDDFGSIKFDADVDIKGPFVGAVFKF